MVQSLSRCSLLDTGKLMAQCIFLDRGKLMPRSASLQRHVFDLLNNLLAFITRPSFQEETGIVLALVFPSSSNRPLLFKVHACTGGISRDRFPAISLAQRQNLFDRRVFRLCKRNRKLLINRALFFVVFNLIFALFLFLFISHYFIKTVHGPGPRKQSMDPVQG